MIRTSSRSPLALTPRDLDILRCLIRYRYLRSTYLHAFVGGASQKRFIERLCELFHHSLIARAPQQWQFADARCQPLVYEQEAKNVRVLLTNDDGDHMPRTCLGASAHRQFKHALAICESLASIELATTASANLRFISWPEILARAPEKTRVFSTPFRLSVRSGAVIPDAIFGIEYRFPGRPAYRFFALEVDRGTMPVGRSDSTQTSHSRKLAVYDEIIAGRAHKQLLGIPNLFILTLTTAQSRLPSLLAAAQVFDSAPWFLFKALNESALRKPFLNLLFEPWGRADQPPLSIFEPA